jgi:hypothetical protein
MINEQIILIKGHFKTVFWAKNCLIPINNNQLYRSDPNYYSNPIMIFRISEYIIKE